MTAAQKQPFEEYVMLVHPVHGKQNTAKWVADTLLIDGSGWRLDEKEQEQTEAE